MTKSWLASSGMSETPKKPWGQTMDDYISREAVNALIKAECSPKVAAYLIDAVATIHAADVRPVVTCERCVYHVDCGYHYCNKWCIKRCPDDADFFCAYGEEES